ncbi:MAG: hypothetical protein ACOYYS_20285 [Chloroflexota bacterium]
MNNPTGTPASRQRNRAIVHAFIRRFFVLLAVSTVAWLLFGEIAYRLVKDPASRPPTTVELLIPAGTAARVAAGEAPPGIPDELVFVAGDTLLVKNEDVVTHQLDILYIPAGASASMQLPEANEFAFSCSFQPDNYLNLTVRQATTWTTRLSALWYGVPVTVMLLLAYSFIFWPLKPQEK